MTIEYSLRRRAAQARLLAIFWLGLATVILVSTYVSLPFFAKQVSRSVSAVEIETNVTTSRASGESSQLAPSAHLQLYALGTLTLGVLAISFCCFLLGRTAFVEIELAARFTGIADALCIAGDNMEQLEKAAQLLVPAAKYLSVPEIFSVKDIQSVAATVKPVKIG